MKVEMPEQNVVLINDGDLVIEKIPGFGYAFGWAKELAPAELVENMKQETSDHDLKDPVSYLSGGNNLSVHASTERAVSRVYLEIWDSFYREEIGDMSLLHESVANMIREGMGRQAVYQLAGGIKKGYKEGLYRGVPLAYIFKGFVDGHINTPTNQPSPGSYAMTR